MKSHLACGLGPRVFAMTKLTDPDRRLFHGFPEMFSEYQFRLDRYPKVNGGGFRFNNLIRIGTIFSIRLLDSITISS